MIKLRVAARVIPENVYLQSLDAPATTPLKGEKKFPVIVRNPDEWYIGTLALEIKKRYESLYRQELGQIKYLKDNEDDCDLDPEQLVSDLLVDEGKAIRDGNDQHVTIKVIQEQGRALRADSVIPDLTPVHFQLRSLPPVPRFDDVQSSLGKRAHASVEDTGRILLNGHGSKRQRHVELPEIQESDEPIASVEKSPELIQDTQSRDLHNNRPKIESPEMRYSARDISPPTVDALEVLPAAPTIFLSRPGGQNQRRQSGSNNAATQRTSGPPERAAGPSNAGRSQIPITPPSEASRSGSGTKPAVLSGSVRGTSSRSPAPHTSSSSKRFKPPVRADVYDLPAPEIDDSQMSPRSKSGRLPLPSLVTSVKSMFGFKPTASNDPTNASKVNEVLKLMSTNQDQSGDTILGQGSQVSRPSKTLQQEATSGQAELQSATDGISSSKELFTPPKTKRKNQRRKSKAKLQGDSEEDATSEKTTEKAAKSKTSGPQKAPRAAAPKRRKGPTLDSPGEQLSHLLQESARKRSISDLAETAFNLPKATDESSSEQTDELDGHLGLGITNSPRKRKAVDPIINESSDGVKASKNTTTPLDSGTKKQRSKKKSDVATPSAQTPSQQVSDKPTASAKTVKATKALPDRTAEQNTATLAVTPGPSGSAATKSPIPVGLTEEEYVLMKSREGMTQEEYAAAKKKKQDAAKKEAAERRQAAQNAKKTIRDLSRPTASATPEVQPKSQSIQPQKAKIPPIVESSTSSSTSKSSESDRSSTSSVDNDSSKTADSKSSKGSTVEKQKPPTTKAVPNTSIFDGPSSSSSSSSSAESSPLRQSEPKPTAKSTTKSPVSSQGLKAKPAVLKVTPKAAPKLLTGKSGVGGAKPTATKVLPKATAAVKSGIQLPSSAGPANLKALRAVLQGSASGSASPVPRSILKPSLKSTPAAWRDDDSDDEEASSSDSSEDATGKGKAAAKTKTKAAQVARPDPTIRDKSVSSDDDDEE